MELQIASAAVQEESGAAETPDENIDEGERRVDEMVEGVKRGGVRSMQLGDPIFDLTVFTGD
jgi:hypothetical protein